MVKQSILHTYHTYLVHFSALGNAMVLEGLKFHLTLQEIANTVHARDRGSVAVQIYYSDPNLS